MASKTTKSRKPDVTGMLIHIEVKRSRGLRGEMEYSLDGQRFSEAELDEMERKNPNLVFVRN